MSDKTTEEKLAAAEAQLAELKSANAELESKTQAAERKGSYAENHAGINANVKFHGKSISPESEAFVKWMVTGQKSAEFKTVTDANTGQLLIPVELNRVIQELRQIKSVVRSMGATQFPMGAATATIAANTAAVTTTWIGENTLIPLSDPTFGTHTFVAKKLAARTALSNEVEQDAIVDMAGYVTTQLASALARAEDTAFLTGAAGSATTPEGITTNVSIPAVAQTGVNAGYDDLARLFFALTPQWRADSAFLMSDTDYAAVVGMTDSQNRPLFVQSITDAAGERLLGRPVIVSPKITAGTVYFGHMPSYYIGDRQGITLARTTEGAGSFEYDTTQVRATERVDGYLTQAADSFRKLTGFAA